MFSWFPLLPYIYLQNITYKTYFTSFPFGGCKSVADEGWSVGAQTDSKLPGTGIQDLIYRYIDYYVPVVVPGGLQ